MPAGLQQSELVQMNSMLVCLVSTLAVNPLCTILVADYRIYHKKPKLFSITWFANFLIPNDFRTQ